LKSAFQKLLDSSSVDRATVQQGIADLLRWAQFGLHLTTPWSVVLTGRPNVGKSSLINALLGYERAIVFDQPGTTRDVVTGETAFEGWSVLLADTAGIRNDASRLEAAGIKLAEERLRSADLRLVLIDLSQPAAADDMEMLSRWPDAIVVAHKSDLDRQRNAQLPEKTLFVSSRTGQGLLELQKAIVNRLVPNTPDPNQPIPLTQRQIERLNEAHDAPSFDRCHNALRQLLHPDDE
jgi:tRNA modification GTPase